MISVATMSKSVHADTLGAWVMVRDERTVYDEWNPVAQIDAAGQVVQRHLWGTDLSGTPQGAGGVGGLLGTWDNGATTRDGSAPGDGVARVWLCAYDGNGNVSAAIAATVAGGGGSGNGGGAGTVRVARYDYDAFGKTLATWGDGAVAEANRYRFSTKPEDGTGLFYYGYRFLDTRMGRWVSRDPIGERGGVNLGGFVKNDPRNNFDRLGLTTLVFYSRFDTESWIEGRSTYLEAQAIRLVGLLGDAESFPTSSLDEIKKTMEGYVDCFGTSITGIVILAHGGYYDEPANENGGLLALDIPKNEFENAMDNLAGWRDVAQFIHANGAIAIAACGMGAGRSGTIALVKVSVATKRSVIGTENSFGGTHSLFGGSGRPIPRWDKTEVAPKCCCPPTERERDEEKQKIIDEIIDALTGL
ncbi:MAG: RHS repeat-associated core domain-containing protein [Verrucomicrobiales bacterium]|nr:RHS repeat-associated core domain-containing protein [Verrucomicrobiales bacterium]